MAAGPQFCAELQGLQWRWQRSYPVPAAEAVMTSRGGHPAAAWAGFRLLGSSRRGEVEPSPAATLQIEKEPGRQPEIPFWVSLPDPPSPLPAQGIPSSHSPLLPTTPV